MQKLLTFLIAIFMVFSGVNAAEIGDGQKNAQIVTTEYVQSYLRNIADMPELELIGATPDAVASEEYVLSAIDFVNGDGNLRQYARPNTLAGISYLPNIADKINTCPVPWDETPGMMGYVDTELLWTEKTIGRGSGNWQSVAYGNGNFVAVGSSDALSFSDVAAISTNKGRTWTKAKLPSMTYWRYVVYGGGIFIAVAPWRNIAAYSSDGGYTWTQYELPTFNEWQSMAYGEWNEENGEKIHRFIAVGANSNAIIYSNDGISWSDKWTDGSTVLLPVSTNWYSVTYGDGTFVAVGANSDYVSSTGNRIHHGHIAYSTDGGKTWTESLGISSDKLWKSVTYGDGIFIAEAGDVVAYSNDGGQTWTEKTLSVPVSAIAYGNGIFVAITGGEYDKSDTVFVSNNGGVNWVKSTLTENTYWVSVIYGGDRFIAVAGGHYAAGVAAMSQDGMSWQFSDLSMAGYIQNVSSMVYGAGKYVALLRGVGSIISEDSGNTWARTMLPPLPEFGDWHSIIYGPDGFVAQADVDNIVAISPDGKNWTTRTLKLPETHEYDYSCYALHFEHDKYFCFSDPGNLLYSKDLENWTISDLNLVNYRINAISYNDNRRYIILGYYAKNEMSCVAYSDNVENWTMTELDENAIRANWIDVTYGNGIFVALAASSNLIMISQDGKKWTSHKLPIDAYWKSIEYINGNFLIVADEEKQYLYSTDAINWTEATLPANVSRPDIVAGDVVLIYSSSDGRIIIGDITPISNTNPWVVGNGCSVADGAITCDTPLVGGVATCENAKCSCTRQKLIKNGEYVDNIAQTPVVINRTFADQNACNMQCANICADNAANNTDGVQKDILCGK